MTFPSLENGRWYALVAGLGAVLTLLAVLQYESSRQISDATTEQMLNNLDGALLNLRLGLESELAPLCRKLQQNETESRARTLAEYARQFENWRRGAAHPGLAAAVYAWRPADTEPGKFFRLDLQRNEFRPAEWPSDFAVLRRRLQEITVRADSGGPRGAGEDRPRVDSWAPVWMIDEGMLVLVHPTPAGLGTRRSHRPDAPWILVTLNLDVLRGHVLPELMQRNFGTQGQQAYQVAVVLQDGGTHAVAYSSDPGFHGQAEIMPDAALNLFGPPVPVARQEGAAPPKSFAVGVRLPDREPGQVHSIRQQALNPGQPDAQPFRIEPIHYPAQKAGWEVIAKHRKGSVEAAVASLYHRSLVFYFCVLLVLATMMGMVIVTSRRARRLAQLQMDFVAGVSHELRTPLTGIVSAAQNIADGVVEEKSRLALYGTAIVRQAHQLGDLVEQILLFSATEKRRYRYHLQPAVIDDLVDASLSSTSALIHTHGVKVERKIQPDLPPVTVDFKAFSQCLQNLIANAVKYGGEQRWLGIYASLQESADHGREVLVAVKDQGIGIEKEDLKHVFEPFYRSPAATAGQIHGSGLGLPLVKTMTEAMGGRLTVETAPQKGSTFTIHLPAENHREGNGRV
jgi:signal transduction histidine kinase